MYSIAIAEAPSSDALWAWFSAGADLRDAFAALESAGAELLLLADDTAWRSKGLQALNERLEEFRDRSAAELGRVNLRQSELERIGGS